MSKSVINYQFTKRNEWKLYFGGASPGWDNLLSKPPLLLWLTNANFDVVIGVPCNRSWVPYSYSLADKLLLPTVNYFIGIRISSENGGATGGAVVVAGDHISVSPTTTTTTTATTNQEKSWKAGKDQHERFGAFHQQRQSIQTKEEQQAEQGDLGCGRCRSVSPRQRPNDIQRRRGRWQQQYCLWRFCGIHCSRPLRFLWRFPVQQRHWNVNS